MQSLADRTFKHILIIKPSSLGDVVRCVPILHGLRGRYPNARVSWLVRPDCKGVLETLGLDSIIEFDRKLYGRIVRSGEATRRFVRFCRELYRERFDLVLDLQGLFRSGFFSLCSGAGVRIGFSNAREFAWCFYTHRVRLGPRREHIVDSYWRFADVLGFGESAKRFDLPVNPIATAAAGDHLRGSGVDPAGDYLVLLPGGTAGSKCWPGERYGELAQTVLARYDIPLVLVGRGATERAAAETIRQTNPERIINLVDQTSLQESVSLIRSSRLVVGNDSGPLHVAAALGVPLVGLYGPTDPAVVGPYGQLDRVVSAGTDRTGRQRYSRQYEHRIEHITVENVFNVIEGILHNH